MSLFCLETFVFWLFYSRSANSSHEVPRTAMAIRTATGTTTPIRTLLCQFHLVAYFSKTISIFNYVFVDKNVEYYKLILLLCLCLPDGEGSGARYARDPPLSAF